MNQTFSVRLLVAVCVLATAAIFRPPNAVAQDHPKEHPTAKQSKEHPAEHPAEHPKEHPAEEAGTAVTKESLAKAIEDYVETASKQSGGAYTFVDEKKDKTLRLTLKKIHKDKLATLGDGIYFACADFTTDDGKVYDLDIFMEGKSADKLVSTEIALHKEEGVERYTWLESKGIWKKVPVGKTKKEKTK